MKVNEELAKRDVMCRIGKLWREYKCKLWNEFYDPLLSRNDLIKNVPEGHNMDQWAIFIDYRLKPSIMNMCNRNKDIRKRQTIPDTGGGMSLSRRRDNLKNETGKNIGRVEMWKITHKRKNGTYVNDEAMEIGVTLFLLISQHHEKIDDLMMQNSETALDISPYDPIGIIFGKEHAGQVRGFSHGACPTLAFKKSTTRLSALLAYIASKEDVPEYLASIAASFPRTLVNEVPDIGSSVPAANDNVGSSAASKTN
ncbi:putative transposase [Vigna unguiculata]|uniref:Putative transposase n=1 Tax=Vigna unguiculata TaxID=3917 RepID=A0A4D6MHL4_VIGUN|nr:putative transposase [Vigna unguiculata]